MLYTVAIPLLIYLCALLHAGMSHLTIGACLSWSVLCLAIAALRWPPVPLMCLAIGLGVLADGLAPSACGTGLCVFSTLGWFLIAARHAANSGVAPGIRSVSLTLLAWGTIPAAAVLADWLVRDVAAPMQMTEGIPLRIVMATGVTGATAALVAGLHVSLVHTIWTQPTFDAVDAGNRWRMLTG